MIGPIHKRVLEGGIRLAGVLDKIFNQSYHLTKEEIELSKKVKEALK